MEKQEKFTPILLPATPNPTLYLIHSLFMEKLRSGECEEFEMSHIVEAVSEEEAELKLHSGFPFMEAKSIVWIVRVLYINEMIR